MRYSSRNLKLTFLSPLCDKLYFRPGHPVGIVIVIGRRGQMKQSANLFPSQRFLRLSSGQEQPPGKNEQTVIGSAEL